MVRARDAVPERQAYNGGSTSQEPYMPLTSAAPTLAPRYSVSPRLILVLAVLGVAMSLIAARPAMAADTYVDQAAGNNANNCLSPAAACLTIGGAAGGIAKAAAGDDVHVAPGTYMEAVTLGAGKSLLATGTAATTIVASTTTDPAIIASGGGGTIAGFTIRAPSSSFAELRLEASATVRDNIFDADSVASKGAVWVNYFA